MNEEEKMKTFDDDAVEGVDLPESAPEPVEGGVAGSAKGDLPESTPEPVEGSPVIEAGEGESEDTVIWDVVFLDGQDPVLVMALESDPEVASVAMITREDVDRLVRAAHRVEKHYSASYRWGRRAKEWAMRRKFFTFGTLAVLVFIVINVIINNL